MQGSNNDISSHCSINGQGQYMLAPNGWTHPMSRANGFKGKWAWPDMQAEREIAGNKSEPVTPWSLTGNELIERADGNDRGEDDEKHLSNSFASLLLLKASCHSAKQSVSHPAASPSSARLSFPTFAHPELFILLPLQSRLWQPRPREEKHTRWSQVFNGCL